MVYWGAFQSTPLLGWDETLTSSGGYCWQTCFKFTSTHFFYSYPSGEIEWALLVRDAKCLAQLNTTQWPDWAHGLRTSLFTVLTVINVLIPDLFWTHREYHPLVVALRKPVATSKVPSFVLDQTLCHSPAWVKPQRGQLATNVVDLKREINIVQLQYIYVTLLSGFKV